MAYQWTPAELRILQDAYPIGGRLYTQKVLAAEGFQRTLKAIAAKAKKQGIRTDRDGRFQPGHVPANKGKGMDRATREKVSRTWFGKGHLPATSCWYRISGKLAGKFTNMGFHST